MAVTAESVIVELEAKFGKFSADAKQAAGSFEQAASRIVKSATGAELAALKVSSGLGTLKASAAGFVGALGISELAQITKASLDYAASLGETSQQIGISTKAYQELSYAATQVGVDQATLESGLSRLTRVLGEAQLGGKQAIAAFQALGIAQKDLANVSPDEALRKVADALAKITDPAKRAAIEVDLFGKSGQKLDTLLSGGTAALDEFAAAAQKLGIVLSDAQIQKADETADKIAALQTVLKANIAGAVAENADGILALANAIAALAGSAGRGLSNVSNYFRGLRDELQNAPAGLAGAGQRLAAILPTSSNLVRLTTQGSGAKLIESLQASVRNFAADGYGQSTGGSIVLPKTTTPKAAATPRAKADPRAELERLLATPDKLSDAFTGISNEASGALAKIDGSAKTLTDTLDKAFSLDNIDSLIVKLPNLSAGLDAVKAAGDKFGENLARNLGQALVYGQSLGDALINSIKAAAAELITSGLLDLLKGGSGSSGGLFGSILGSIGSLFGGGRAIGGPVTGNTPYLVGERGPELFVPSANGNIRPAGSFGGSAGVTINVTNAISLAGNAATKEDAAAFARIAYEQSLSAFRQAQQFGIPSV